MRQCVLILLSMILAISSALAAFDDARPQLPRNPEKEVGKKASFKMKEATDVYALAKDLARTFMTEEEWKTKVKEAKDKYNDWSRDNDGDAGLYLNCRLLIVGLSAVGGKVDKIKESVVWVSLYKEFNQPLPAAFLTFAKNNKDSLNRVLKDFSWNRVSDYIKNRQWRQDAKDAEEVAKAKEVKDTTADAR